MHSLMVWSVSILILLVPASFTASTDSCDTKWSTLQIGKCENVSGPPVSCNNKTVEHLQNLKLLEKSYQFVYNLSNEYKINSRCKQLVTLLTDYVLLQNFLNEAAPQDQHALGTHCIDMKSLENNTKFIQILYVPYLQWMEGYFLFIGGLELMFGMLGNIMIVTIYVRHQDMRTGPNMVILNLALGDMFLIIGNIVVFYSSLKWLLGTAITICQLIPYLRTIGVAVSVYSTVVLSILRYLATAATPGSRSQKLMQKRTTVPVMLLIVWILAGLTVIPELISTNGVCPNCTTTRRIIRTYPRFICLCLLPLFVIGVLSVVTSRIIHRSAEQMPGEQTSGVLHEQRSRRRGANVILALVVVFCITFLPLNIFYIILTQKYEHGFVPVTHGKRMMHSLFLTQVLIPLNSCLNPVALFVGSAKFRKYFQNSIAKWFKRGTCNVPGDQCRQELCTVNPKTSPQGKNKN